MSLKNNLTDKIIEVSAEPQNEFDKIIHNNIDIIVKADEKTLSEIYTLRRKAERLCRLIPYLREDIALLTESGAVDTHNKVAELEDCFSTLEYLISKIKNETY